MHFKNAVLVFYDVIYDHFLPGIKFMLCVKAMGIPTLENYF